MDLRSRIATLVAGLDPSHHANEIATLQSCRGLDQLEALAAEGWLSAEGTAKRLRLVRHGSGTFLIVEYDDGWTRTLSRA